MENVYDMFMVCSPLHRGAASVCYVSKAPTRGGDVDSARMLGVVNPPES